MAATLARLFILRSDYRAKRNTSPSIQQLILGLHPCFPDPPMDGSLGDCSSLTSNELLSASNTFISRHALLENDSFPPMPLSTYSFGSEGCRRCSNDSSGHRFDRPCTGEYGRLCNGTHHPRWTILQCLSLYLRSAPCLGRRWAAVFLILQASPSFVTRQGDVHLCKYVVHRNASSAA